MLSRLANIATTLTWGARLARRLATEPAVSPGGTTSAPAAGGSGSGAETKSPNSSSSDDSSAASAAACDGSGAGSTWPAAARTTWAALAYFITIFVRPTADAFIYFQF